MRGIDRVEAVWFGPAFGVTLGTVLSNLKGPRRVRAIRLTRLGFASKLYFRWWCSLTYALGRLGARSMAKPDDGSALDANV